mmetsp:Transcript_550/g.935  ORF Transcript_550/g.935 Transcript_550/m.935 type:complete len:135 (+) Transcript_550:21-425(+)|eukprot:CAMPEP_0197531066 /NCGR_PEP_ID=MMETSP1318-20131121/33960_1 /TAXON_ID=552666 /ORGANISM="Partenskyella glossopodia, Strain RCC365" /LENGTH=134 /DNA_ID=CAMNT_0043087145 /DNA_START=12 /DNA_END=416 /DNA_ORIENTATION=+
MGAPLMLRLPLLLCVAAAVLVSTGSQRRSNNTRAALENKQTPSSSCNSGCGGSSSSSSGSKAIHPGPDLFDGNELNIDAVDGFGLSDSMSTSESDMSNGAQLLTSAQTSHDSLVRTLKRECKKKTCQPDTSDFS